MIYVNVEDSVCKKGELFYFSILGELKLDNEFTTFDGKWLCIFFFLFGLPSLCCENLCRWITAQNNYRGVIYVFHTCRLSWDKVDENTNVERSSIISIGGRQENAR